jgi:hypothetical protein
VIGNQPITLANGNTIKVDGTTGVFFSTTAGKIESDTYKLGGVVGTLSGDKTFLLGAALITKGGDDDVTLTYTGKTNAAESIILLVNESKALTVTNANINLNEETAGSISLGSGSASIILGSGGSITTGADTTHTLAWGGTIYTDYAADGGSLVSGSIAGYSAGGSITEGGSVGTTGGNFITQNGSFAILDQDITSEVIEAALTTASTEPDEKVSQAKGSIAVFQTTPAE